MKNAVLRWWQADVLTKLFRQCDRKVLWVVEESGNSGKSWLARYLCYLYGYDYLDGVTASKDICHMLSDTPAGFVFDVTRDDSSKFSYQTLEQCKNGRVMTGKYRGTIKEFAICPVLVVSNVPPVKEALSADRWHVIYQYAVHNTPLSPEEMDAFKTQFPPPTHLWEDEKDPQEEDPQQHSQLQVLSQDSSHTRCVNPDRVEDLPLGVPGCSTKST